MLVHLRHAALGLCRAPGFAFVAILSLALGIGANTAIFSLTDQIFWRSLSVRDPEQLVLLEPRGPSQGRHMGQFLFSYPMYKDLRDGNQVFTGLAGSFGTRVSLTVAERIERVDAEIVTGNYFNVLGVRMALGRPFAADEDRTPLTRAVVVLSHAFWQRQFGGDRNAIGTKLLVNGSPYEVVGVASPEFRSLNMARSPALFVPAMMQAHISPSFEGLPDRKIYWLRTIGRLKPGVSRAQAEESLTVLWRPFLEAELSAITGWNGWLRDQFVSKRLLLADGSRGTSPLRDQFRSPFFTMLIIAGLLLLMSCVNVANLLIARAAARRREIAVRIAMGASKRQLFEQLLTESLLLAALAGGAGILAASWIAPGLLEFLPDTSRVNLTADIDLRVFVTHAAVSLLTGLLFGFAPAWQAFRPDFAPALKNGSRPSRAPVLVRWRKNTVTAQVAVSLILLIGAGLLVRSLHKLQAVHAGFRVENLTTFQLDPMLSGYDADRSLDFFARVSGQLRQLPGVESVAIGRAVPLSSALSRASIRVEGFEEEGNEDMNPVTDVAGPGYFRTLGIPMIAGREISEQDIAERRKVVVVNRRFARYFFGPENPLGRRISFGLQAPDTEIVGVAGDIAHQSLRDDASRIVYVSPASAMAGRAATFFVRTSGSARDWPAAVRNVVQRIDPAAPVADIKTLETQWSDSLYLERMLSALATFFGMLATLLSAIGLYGVMAYSVIRRTREIGIRMALGARGEEVLSMVMRESARLTIAGTAIGLPAAVLLWRLAESRLFGVSALDPLTLAASSAAIIAAMFVAGLFPAWRATCVEPVSALRYE